MRAGLHIGILGSVLVAGLAGCAPQGDVAQAPFAPVYRGIQTRLLDGDLVNFHVRMTGARAVTDVADYAQCAAAQYAVIRGYGFARHVRTNVNEEAGLWQGDAVYTISPALPQGLRTIDAEVAVNDCADNGIPTV